MSNPNREREVAIFASGNSEIGGGHLSRQMVLAQELVGLGFSVSLVGELSGTDVSQLERTGIKLIEIQDFTSLEQHQSALGKIMTKNSIHCAVIDNYSLLAQLSGGVDLNCEAPQVHFQDGQESAPGGAILVNSGITSDEPYSHSKYETVFLGLEAVLISKRVKELRRERQLRNTMINQPPLGFITLGFGNHEFMLRRVLEALKAVDTEVSRNFMVARKEDINYASLAQRHNSLKGLTSVGYSEALVNFDICIGASGLSAYERAFLGIPSINIPLAQNQLGIGRILVSRGVALDLSDADDDSLSANLGRKLAELNDLEYRKSMVRASVKLINPDNARKIGHAIKAL